MQFAFYVWITIAIFHLSAPVTNVVHGFFTQVIACLTFPSILPDCQIHINGMRAEKFFVQEKTNTKPALPSPARGIKHFRGRIGRIRRNSSARLKYFYSGNPQNKFVRQSPLCGTRLVHQSVPSRIIGGRNALPGELPFQVALYNERLYYGTGTLITDRHVLTCGHCIDGYVVSLILVGEMSALTKSSRCIFPG